MKKLNSYPLKEQLCLIYKSKELTERLDERIQESEMDYISDLLGSFSFSVADWSIGFYNQNYIDVKDDLGFLESVEEMIDVYSGSEKLLSLASQARKLWNRDSNLFSYIVKKLCSEVYEMLKGICDFVENLCYKTYCKEEDDSLLDYLDDWIFEDVYVSNNGELVSLKKY